MSAPIQPTPHKDATWLRTKCGHDSRSVDGCRYCEVADELERLETQLVAELKWRRDNDND